MKNRPTATRRPATKPARPVVLVAAREAVRARRAADHALLEHALAWLQANLVDPAQIAGLPLDCGYQVDRTAGLPATPPVEGRDTPAALYGDQAVRVGGDGTPLVWGFAVDEFSAAVEMSTTAALGLAGDVLDLAYRFPRTWARVRSGKIAISLAREVVTVAGDLPYVAALDADRMIAGQPGLNPHRIRVLVDEARLYHDPDRERDDEDHDAALRYVRVRHDLGAEQTSAVEMRLDTPDAEALDHTLDDLAHRLADYGHPGTHDQRRAAAVGTLADPQTALETLHPDLHADPDPEPETEPNTEPKTDLGPANPFVRRHRPDPDVTIVLHLSDRTLLEETAGGVVTHEKLGAFTTRQIEQWLVGSTVKIRPVLDPHAVPAVDRHDPPEAMVEAMRLRDPVCVFPACTRGSRHCDADHIDPYVPPDEGGPPGQTSLDNLAPLCRRHHRAKTHGHFTYRRLPDGSYEWTLPTGMIVTTHPPPRRTSTLR